VGIHHDVVNALAQGKNISLRKPWFDCIVNLKLKDVDLAIWYLANCVNPGGDSLYQRGATPSRGANSRFRYCLE
jgi:hypothetical protein